MTNKKQNNTRVIKRHKRNYSKRARRLQKEMLASLVLIFLVVFLMIKFHSAPTHYRLVVYQADNQMEEVQYYTSFKTAKREMNKLIEDGAFNPAILNEEDQILAIKYGVVNFRTKTCGENTSYTNEFNGRSGYTNGCYGADGAYLETDDRGERIKFKQSGVVGWVNLDEVELLNYTDVEKLKSINHYMLNEGAIMHQGTTDLTQNEYAIAISIGEAKTTFPEGTLYSYDGHYFYDSYETMIDDYRAHSYARSINAEAPHYNYYQYLSHRGKTSYVSKDLNWYISTYLGYQAKPTAYPPNDYESQLYEEGYSFIEAQNTYGVNALMMLSLAINESGFGRSEISISKNNLFGHAAYDNAPDESANGYVDVAASITTHASIFLNQGYLNPCDQSEEGAGASTCYAQEASRYLGGFFGDKGSGMNVNYASDPYWGEKAAQYYRNMDEILGGDDLDRYDIKVLENKAKTPAYAQADASSKIIFYTPMVEHYAMIVLEEVEGKEVNGSTTWYKIQSDGALNNARNAILSKPENYASKNDIVYIPASAFDTKPNTP